MKNFEDDLKPVQLYKSLYPKKVLANKKWFKSNLNEIKKRKMEVQIRRAKMCNKKMLKYFR